MLETCWNDIYLGILQTKEEMLGNSWERTRKDSARLGKIRKELGKSKEQLGNIRKHQETVRKELGKTRQYYNIIILNPKS